MRIAILCNGRTLADWQRRAIELIAGRHELYLLVCDDPPTTRNLLRHGLYYLLNLLSVRNRRTRPVPFPTPEFRIADRIDFQADLRGGWASLPNPALDWIAERRIDAVLKFGLNLLTVPEAAKLAAPILSYHHGDPRRFRGRPAGFYELQQGERFLGQIVQILSNKLDSGEVLAFAESRVANYSYRRTLSDAFALSPPLLPVALSALESGDRLPIRATGNAYRLPSNGTVLRFAAGRMARLVRHLAYGAFVEKRWRVSTTSVGLATDPLHAIDDAAAACASWRTLPVRPPHRFHADPFFHGDEGALLIEAMNRRTGKGDLVRVEGNAQHIIAGLSGHVSYPAGISEGGRDYVVPEVCGWSRPAIFAIENNAAVRIADLDIHAPAILDPTLLRHEGHIYLFGNRREDGPSILRLWSAGGLFDRFEEHPASPVRTSVRGGRMAGSIHLWPAGLIRLGQDFGAGYGDGIIAFRIEELTPDRYRETEIGARSFDRVKGPHTLDAHEGTLLFDWYEESFSPLAGIRRLMNRL
ncbi:MAG: glucosamine inositolphosphorylceramide transferase family protein [Sphingomicrobium sp.]